MPGRARRGAGLEHRQGPGVRARGCLRRPRHACAARRPRRVAPVRAGPLSRALRRSRLGRCGAGPGRARAAPPGAARPRVGQLLAASAATRAAENTCGSASGPRGRRSRRRRTCPARTGAASYPAPAAWPPGARAPTATRRRRRARRAASAARAAGRGLTASITCSAWPSITAITACTRSSVSRSGSLVDDRDEVARAQRAGHPADLAAVGDGACAGPRSAARRGEQLAHQPGHVPCSHGTPRELHGVGHLVQRHPGHELLLVGARRSAAPAEVRQHEQQPRRRGFGGFVEQHQLVLAEHALGEVARRRRRPRWLTTQRRARADRPGAAGPGSRRRARAPGPAARASSGCWPRSTRAGRSPPAGAAGGGLQAGVGGDPGLGSAASCASRRRARRRVAACRRRTRRSARRRSSRSLAASCLQCARSVSGERAATTGELGVDVERGGERRRRSRGSDQRAALADDQLAGRGVDPAARRSDTIPSNRAAATWHRVEAIVPSARSR